MLFMFSAFKYNFVYVTSYYNNNYNMDVLPLQFITAEVSAKKLLKENL